MAKRSYSWYNLVAKILIGITSLLGLVLMIIASYDLTETLREASLEKKIQTEIALIEKLEHDHGYTLNEHKYIFIGTDSKSGSVQLSKKQRDGGGGFGYENSTEPHPAAQDPKRNNKYRTFLLVSQALAIILGFVQMFCSFGIVCSCSPYLPRRIKAWLIVLSFVFLLGFLCLIVPLTLNPRDGSTLNTSDFVTYLKGKIHELKSVKNKEQSLRNMFLYLVAINQGYLLLALLTVGILLPFGTQSYNSVD